MSKVRVESDGTCEGTRISVDGKPLTNVIAFRFEMTAPELGKLTLEMLDVELDVSALPEGVTVNEIRREETLCQRA